MKKLLLFAIPFLIGVISQAQPTWISQATAFPVTSTGVFNVSAVDANTVWISSYDGSGGGANFLDFSRTTDGGATWTAGVVSAPAGHAWCMIDALDASTAWAMFYNATVGTGGGIWKTTDGGATWNQQGVGTIFNATSFPDVVYFWDANNGFSMGDPNSAEFEIYTTTDGGTTWVPVPAANIPNPLAGEYGIVDHFCVIGNTVWFDTNKGRVYKSTDMGLTWTVGSTGITVPANGAIDVVFWDANNGLARLYNGTTGVNTIKRSTDGGATWTAGTATGNFWGSDVKYIPGTTSKLLSTGAATGFIGSSVSYDGGLNWVDIETSAQRTAIGVVDSNNMWCGGFTTSPTSDGIFKYAVITPLACTDPSVNPGTAVGSDSLLCFGDTLTVTSTGVVSPVSGSYSGVSWVISSADVSGTSDPLNEPSLIAAYNFSFPAPSTSIRQLINDGTFIGTAQVPYGIYYWTPIVFGDATAATSPPVFLNDLLLDINCTAGGNSVMVNVLAPGDPLCTVGINENHITPLAVYSNVKENNIELTINSSVHDKAIISIYDVTGRIVYNGSFYIAKGVNHENINAQNFGTGAYIVKVETANAKAVNKLVKF